MKKIKVEKIEPVFKDERGIITDLLNKKVSHIGVIVTEKGAIRGNHYHKKSTQYSYIISGKFEVFFAPSNNILDSQKILLNAGELITIPPFNIHKFKALQKSVMLDIVSESRAGKGYEKDVVRVDF